MRKQILFSKKLSCFLVGKHVWLPFFLLLTFFGHDSDAQTVINVDLTASPNAQFITGDTGRSGAYCGDNNCIVFNITLNPGSDLLTVTSSQITGASFYTIDCGPQIPSGTPSCITGKTTVTYSFCKPGNNTASYTISASTAVKASPDLSLRQGCSGTMSVTGMQPATTNWTSIYPGAAGAYNSYLSSTSGATVNVSPVAGAPAYIDYKVSGTITSCPASRSDTVRVYTYPPLTVALTPLAPVICATGGSIDLTATPTGGNGSYTYLWSNGQTTPSITAYSIGTYTVTISDGISGCPPVSQSVTVTAAPTPAAPTVSPISICTGNTATLTALAPGGTYSWFNVASGGTPLATGATYTTPVLTASITYYVETMLNGCTSSRTAVTVTVNPIPTAPIASGSTICSGSNATLSATGPGGSYQWYNALTGGILLASGASLITPVLIATTTYYVQTTVNGCTSPRTAVTVTVNPIPTAPTVSGATICSGSTATLMATGPGGTYQWYDASTGGTLLITSNNYTTGSLTSTTTYYVQTTINGCTSPRTSVTVTVNPIPVAPTASGATICSGSTASLSATGPGGSYQWYSAATGGNLLATNSSYTTSALTATTTYYVQTTINGCTSARTPVIVTVNPIPAAPTVSPITICSGSTAFLSATAPGGIYEWYAAASGGIPLAINSSYTTPSLTGTTTYYVQTTVNGCISQRTAVTVTVTPIPAAPTVSGVAICSGSTASLTATAPGGTYEWYDASTGGNILASGSVYTSGLQIATTTYYVQTTVNGCTSPRTAVTISVNPIPAAPTVAAQAPICSGSSTTLAVNVPNGIYKWYSQASGGTVLFTGDNFTSPVLTDNATYYVDVTSLSGCTSSRTAVTVNVTQPEIPAFLYGSGTYCQTGTNPTPVIQGTNSGGKFTSSTGLFFVNDITGEINLSASPVGLHTITFTSNNSCAFVYTSNLTITLAPSATFSFGGPYCQSETNPFPIFLSGSSAGIFSATPAGLVFLNASTGEIDLSNSAPGTYSVINTIVASGGCLQAIATNTVTVLQTPTVTSSTGGAGICNNTAQNYTITSNTTGTTFSWSRAAVTGISNTAGTGMGNIITEMLTNIATSAIAVEYIIVPSANGCNGPAFTYTVIVQPTPKILSSSINELCNSTPQNYTILSDVAGATFSWSRAQVLNISNPAVTAQTSNIITETLVNTGSSPIAVPYTIIPFINGCPGIPLTYTVTVNPTPVINSANSALNCNNTAQNYFITSNVSGASFVWSRAAVNGISNAAVSVQTSGTITEALDNTTSSRVDVSYIITPTANGCTGPSFTYVVTVKPTPTITSAPSAIICNNIRQNYAIISNVSGTTFIWSRAFIAGINNPAVSNQTGNSITETLVNAGTNPVEVVYTIVPTAGGCTGPAYTYTVTVNPTPIITSAITNTLCNAGTQNYLITSNISNATFSWSRVHVNGISNSAVSGQTSGSITETLTNITSLPIAVTYTIDITANGCTGPLFIYTVTVNPTPIVTSAPIAEICNNTPQNYAITSNMSGTSFSWSRASVPGISNLAASGTGNTISETLINTGASATTVYYFIVPTANGCAGPAFIYSVTVNPTPKIISETAHIVCNSEIQNYSITSNVAGAIYTWSRAGVSGISNAPVANQTSGTISEALVNITSSPLAVSYQIIPIANGCSGPVFNYTVTVNPTPIITNSSMSQTVCSQSNSILVVPTSNVLGATFTWTANASSGISGFTSTGSGNIPAQTLINSGTAQGKITYTLIPSYNGCPGTPSTYTVFVNPKPATPVIATNSPVCEGYTLNLTAPTISGATYSWTGPNGFSSALQNPSIANATSTEAGIYSLSIIVNGCLSNAATALVSMLPTPAKPAIVSNSPVCSGNTLTLSTNTVSGAIYSWTGPNGFTSSLQNPQIPNAAASASGMYSLTITINGCTSPAGNLSVVINETPVTPTAGSNGPVCEGGNINLFANSIAGATYSWKGPNGFLSNLQNPVISSAKLINSGDYYVTATVAGCTSTPPKLVNVIVNAVPVNAVATSNSPVCATYPLQLTVTSLTGAIYKWTGPNGFTSNVQNPVISNADPNNSGVYTVLISSPGCTATLSKSISVKVNPSPIVPIVSSNSPLCTGTNLTLFASAISGATYIWTGPNGFTSNLQNPILSNIAQSNVGTYKVIAIVDGCTSPASTTIISINEPAIASAGIDQVVCANNAQVALSGTITGGSTSGIWSTNGSGTFIPSNSTLKAIYIPSGADKAQGKIILTLSSTNNRSCAISQSSMVITITPSPEVDAGADQVICTNDPGVYLSGKARVASGGIWSTNGTGTFIPSNTKLDAMYVPSNFDKANGSVVLTLKSSGNGNCLPVTDNIFIKIMPPPTISKLTVKYVFEGETTTFDPVVSGSELQYLWTPKTYLNSDIVRNPTVTGVENQLYTLTVVGAAGCSAKEQVQINVLKPIVIPNTFTPNGDGINDVWNIKELSKYPGAQLTIFNRYCTKLFYCQGYAQPWDGMYNGQPLPVGTYYYVINIESPIYTKVYSGFIALLK